MNKFLIKIKGIKPKNFVLKLNRKKIKIYKVYYINQKEINILIEEKDLESVLKEKTIYEIEVLKQYGKKQIKKNIINNKIFIICTFIGVISLFLLSSFAFKIKIMHTDQEIIDLLNKELFNNDIKVNQLKKSFKQIQKIKEKIINNNKNKIEWLEIETKGIYYIVKIEERKLKKENNNYTLNKIVSKKDAVIKKIISQKGNIIKNVNDYVKKGDVIISNEILLNDNIVNYTTVEGTIYGEVWYNINVRYPYNYFNIIETKKSNKTVSYKLINKSINIYDTKKFKNKIRKEKTILLNKFIPFGFVSYYEKEVIIDDSYQNKDYLKKAIELGLKKIDLKENEYVVKYKVLNQTYEANELVLELFVIVYENITAYTE